MKHQLQQTILSQLADLDERLKDHTAMMASIGTLLEKCLPAGSAESGKQELPERLSNVLYQMGWAMQSLAGAKRDLCEALSHITKMED